MDRIKDIESRLKNIENIVRQPGNNCIVTKDINYVCGSNGQTYMNPSAARCAGITQFNYGACNSKSLPFGFKPTVQNSSNTTFIGLGGVPDPKPNLFQNNYLRDKTGMPLIPSGTYLRDNIGMPLVNVPGFPSPAPPQLSIIGKRR